jgi:hypothetical protein
MARTKADTGNKRGLNMKDFDFDKVSSVYVGKKGRCCCGCSGTHFYKNETREFASKNRGYEVLDEEINDDKVKRVINKIKKYIIISDSSDTYISVTIGNTLYIAYISNY